MDEDDYIEEDRECCREACIVVYHYGVAVAHCYRGTRSFWEERVKSLSSNSSVLFVGATADD